MADEGTSSARIWLFLLREGGRWNTSDIADETDDMPAYVAGLLGSMESRGHVRKWERNGSGTRVTWGVTLDCKIPNGVTLADIAACGALRLEPA